MARKILSIHSNSLTLASAKVYRDTDYGEFVVVFYRQGVKQVGANYHTDDRKDAESTAAHFVTTIES